jgi:arylsulfatase A-like enzyme
MFGEHGLMEHANGLWEENLRVPFLLFGANLPAGELPWVPQLDDVAPTLLTLAGLPVPPDMTGAPLLLPADGVRPNGSRAPAELRVAPAPQRAHAGAQEREVTVRAGGWKWTGAWDAAGGSPAPLRAADLAQDPFERTALAEWPEALRAAVTLALARDTWARRERPAAGSLQRGLAGQLGYAGN